MAMVKENKQGEKVIDSIFKRQNEKEILALLYAQRVCYDCAEIFNRIGWLLTFIILLQEIIKGFVSINECVSLLISVIIAFAVYIADSLKKKYITNGAKLKNLVDSLLYGFTIENLEKEKLMDLSIELKNKNMKKYQQQITHDGAGTIKGVKDWYTRYDNSNHEKVILNCQSQNLWWNEKLVAIYKNVFIGIMLIIIVISLGSMLIIGLNTSVILTMLIFMLTFSARCFDKFKSIIAYNKAMIRAEGKLQILQHNVDQVGLNELQKEIDIVRETGFLIPNFIHQLYSFKLHQKRQNLNDHLN